jgi:hypothetical protein
VKEGRRARLLWTMDWGEERAGSFASAAILFPTVICAEIVIYRNERRIHAKG